MSSFLMASQKAQRLANALKNPPPDGDSDDPGTEEEQVQKALLASLEPITSHGGNVKEQSHNNASLRKRKELHDAGGDKQRRPPDKPEIVDISDDEISISSAGEDTYDATMRFPVTTNEVPSEAEHIRRKGGVHAVRCRKLERNALRMHYVYSMFTLHVFLACFCDVFIVIYMTRPLEGVLMARYSHSKPLTLEAAHAARLCGEDAWLDGAPTPCNRYT